MGMNEFYVPCCIKYIKMALICKVNKLVFVSASNQIKSSSYFLLFENEIVLQIDCNSNGTKQCDHKSIPKWRWCLVSELREARGGGGVGSQHLVYGILSISIHTISIFLVMLGLAFPFNCFPSPGPDLDPS